MLVGAGAAGSSVDAANILKPALSRGELQVIGATTLDEYRKHIESDAALERRFQPVQVDEPSEQETIEILKGVRSAYEEHHHLVISDAALEAAAHLSSRYVTERFLPDKAIDLIDESSSRVRMYKSPAAKQAKDLFGQLRTARQNRSLAQEEGNADDIKEWEDREMDLGEQIERLRSGWDRASSPVVSAEDIAEVVSMWTGVPLMQLAEAESQRLLKMEDELRKSIIGQDDAILAISRAVRRARAGLKDPKRPIGSFIFLGPTGVGKTELTKTLAKFMFGSEDAAIQLDMSEFMERHTAARLVGAPPGYIGYEDAGQLTEALRRRPYSIIVFDEVEKAHPEVHNMLLQIMEEGHLSDAKGRKVDFRNSIIIMTYNIGAELIRKGNTLGFVSRSDESKVQQKSYDRMKENLLGELKKTFRPEFINRIDGVVVFHPLDKDQIRQIVDLMLVSVTKQLAEKGIKLEITETAKDLLGRKGYDEVFGARPLRRTIQDLVEDRLSEDLLRAGFKDGDSVVVDLAENGEELSIAVTKKAEPALSASEAE